jgi:hypothetical protein
VRKLTVHVRPGAYAVLRFAGDAAVPAGVLDARIDGLTSVTRTADELTVVCPEEFAVAADKAATGWRLLTTAGPFEFTLTGIMAALSSALAAAGVPLFALSTFDTDHLLVKADDLVRAVDALRDAGHEVVEQS